MTLTMKLPLSLPLLVFLVFLILPIIIKITLRWRIPPLWTSPLPLMPLAMRTLTNRKYKAIQWSNIQKNCLKSHFDHIFSHQLYIFSLFDSNISNTFNNIHHISKEALFETIIIFSKHTWLINKGERIASNFQVVPLCGVTQLSVQNYPSQ